MYFLKAVFLGLSRSPWRCALSFLAIFSTLWMLIESATALIPDFKVTGWSYYGMLVLMSLVGAVGHVYPRRRIRFKVGHSNTWLNVYFGDIFKADGHKAIPVNEYFDSKVGQPIVSETTLHGQLLNRYFGGHPQAFDKLVDDDLMNVPCVQVNRTQGKQKKYELGTTAHITANGADFLLFAICHTEATTYKASSGIIELVLGLRGLISKARGTLGGKKLVVPLAGSGLGGIGLDPQHLLLMILLLIIDETKTKHFATEVDIVLYFDKFEEVNLEMIEKFGRSK